MIIDSQALLSDAQSLAIANGATAVSTNSYDLGVAGTNALGFSPLLDPGRGAGLKLFVGIVTAPGGASSTLQVQVIESDNADLSSPVVLEQTADIAVATLVAGYRFRLGTVPAGCTKRYVGVKYLNNSGASMTGGGITAAFVQSMPDAFIG